MGKDGVRRSERVVVDVPVVVRGHAAGSQEFTETTSTVKVSAHGALIVLKTHVRLGDRIVLANPETSEEMAATVAFLGPPHGGRTTVGVQFAEPAPDFWPVMTPPRNWKQG
jgi:PilZ domain